MGSARVDDHALDHQLDAYARAIAMNFPPESVRDPLHSTEQHVSTCPLCQSRLRAAITRLTEDRALYSCLAGGPVHYPWIVESSIHVYEGPDRPGLIFDITRRARQKLLNLKKMNAFAQNKAGHGLTATIGFVCDGTNHAIADFDGEEFLKAIGRVGGSCRHEVLRVGDSGNIGYRVVVHGDDRENVVLEFVHALQDVNRARILRFVARTLPSRDGSERVRVKLIARVLLRRDSRDPTLDTLKSWAKRRSLTVTLRPMDLSLLSPDKYDPPAEPPRSEPELPCQTPPAGNR
ncbi:MAG: hypothetical protein U0638_12590 [Phycisphaerales bacterium]